MLAALQQVALAYLTRTVAGEIPFWRMVAQPVAELRGRAEKIVAAAGTGAVADTESVPGAGSAPGVTIPSCGVVLEGDQLAVLRSQATSLAADSHDRTTVVGSNIGAAGQAAFEGGNRSVPQGFNPATGEVPSQQASTGYTPAALEALGQRWEAYAAAQATGGAGSQITDSHGRVDMPMTSPASTSSVEDSDIAWRDLVYGMLLGFALIALGGIAAFALRSHGRVAQS